MAKFIAAAKQFVVAEEGASLVEYGLLVTLIAVVCIAGQGPRHLDQHPARQRQRRPSAASARRSESRAS